MSGNELGSFLRARREALTPADVGLPTGPRRRALGLRRAEVAALADVSVEYVTRLEQGRDRHPSFQVVAALAEALRLSPGEREHLYALTKVGSGVNCLGGVAVQRTVRPTVRALLDRLEPTPAAVLNRLSEVVAHTTGYERLMGPIGLLDGDPPNVARFVLADPRARTAYPDWVLVADQQVAALKHGPFRADPQLAALADELTVTAGEAFRRRVETVSGMSRPTGIVRLAHPRVGELRLAYETLALPADDDQSLVAYLPADPATATALDTLLTPRTPLRLVPAS
ncbi:helix-turn-helix transcriptional regulator [Actinomycetes bacterium KLBMP 9797]